MGKLYAFLGGVGCCLSPMCPSLNVELPCMSDQAMDAPSDFTQLSQHHW